jgi:hypothetical protein
MPFPALVGTGGTAPQTFGSATEQFTFKAKSSSLPGDTIGQIPVSYFGREIKVAGNRTFPEWTVTIINDEDFTLKTTFERWMSSINSHVQNLRDPAFLSGDGGYEVDAIVNQYGKAGNVIKQYKMVGCWPTDVSPIDVGWENTDSIEEFQVTFALQWWESPDSTDSSTSTSFNQTF